ncbi:hypothetical protein [Halocatena marina]|uniref:hypothetical protein n=1 Tax=Halocatena marina TaxID=2934937 RepID=UPI00200C4FB3
MAVVETLVTEILTSYGHSDPDIQISPLNSEDDFDAIYAHVKGGIEDTKAADAAVAVDVTPGRKFMTAIAFAAGLRYDADHVYYLYLNLRRRGHLFFELPRTSTTLYDFKEMI